MLGIVMVGYRVSIGDGGDQVRGRGECWVVMSGDCTDREVSLASIGVWCDFVMKENYTLGEECGSEISGDCTDEAIHLAR